MKIILFLVILGLCFIGFNWLMGYRKNHITIDLDERYVDFKEYIEAIKSELANQGREVSYIGNRKFIIDGQTYFFIERNVSMGGVPLQRTILKPEKD
jgi:hypothetical protein